MHNVEQKRPAQNLPKTVDEAVKRLTSDLPLKDKTAIANLAENDLAQLNLENRIEADSERYSFSELDLNNIQSYADLIGGSVIVSKESNQVQVLFPVTMTKAAGDSLG